MKTERRILINLVLVIGLALAGCTRSRYPVSVASAADTSAPRAEASPIATLPPATEAVLSVPAPTSTVAPVTTPLPVLAVSPADVQSDLAPLSRTVNILLLGSDRRPDEPNWRTDVLMLISLDMEGQQAAAISFPRDIYIDAISGHKPNKINVIDYLGEQDKAGGGPELLASILTEKTGIPIDAYLRFDFEGFKQVVDALGGVELNVECRVYEYLPEEDINLYLEPGVQRLGGKMALGYVRARNQGGDLERARRQQKMVLSVRDQLLSENQLPHLPALYAALQGAVQTDIGFVDAIRFARFALQLSEDDIHGMVIAPPDLVRADWRGGMSVWLADWPLIAERVQTVFERPPLVQTNTVGAVGDRVQCP